MTDTTTAPLAAAGLERGDSITDLRTSQPAAAPKPTMTDVCNTLTGYDEIAITREFGKDFAVLVNYPTSLGRALVFILKRRDGLTDKEAKRAAMEMRLGDVNDYFDSEDDGAEDPENPVGEGDSRTV